MKSSASGHPAESHIDSSLFAQCWRRNREFPLEEDLEDRKRFRLMDDFRDSRNKHQETSTELMIRRSAPASRVGHF